MMISTLLICLKIKLFNQCILPTMVPTFFQSVWQVSVRSQHPTYYMKVLRPIHIGRALLNLHNFNWTT